VAPDLALKADVTRDGRTYTLALRPGVRWEDKAPLRGRELSAADVKFSLERLHRRGVHAALLGPLEAIEIADRHTLRVHLTEAFAPLLANLAEPWTAVIPRELDDRPAEARGADGLIGCGPFTLERYEPGVKAVFARNPTYHARGLPYLDKVEWLFVKDRSTQLALFRAGQVDVPYHDGRIPRSAAGALRRSNPDYPVVFWDSLAVPSLAMRTDKPPFNDVRVRRALSLAVDRRAWVARHLDGHGTENHGPVPAAMPQWELGARHLGEGARYLEHDPALARQLLAEAGFPGGLKVKCTSWPGHGPEHLEDLELLAGNLRGVGVELQIVNEEHGPYSRGSLLGKLDETTWGLSPIFTEVDDYLYTFLRSGQAGNRSHVTDTQLDVMLEAQRCYTSASSRRKIIHDIQRRAAAYVYYVYTPYPKAVSSWAPRVRNYGPKNSFDRGAQLEVVWLTPP
jgi:ABC-type transport system substrate-binding protein